jgi:Co/Zn/Cd efflux system component
MPSMPHDGHTHNLRFDGAAPGYRRVLWVVIALNAAMFVVEILAGALAGSQALKADALDFLADALTYGLSLAVIGRPLATRATVALLKGLSLMAMGLWVLGSTLWQLMVFGLPDARVMGGVGLMALSANLASVALLLRSREGDANVRSVWLCSRNDAIGNVAVMAAAVAVAMTETAWPDLLVAVLMSALFLSSARQIIGRGWVERRSAVAGAARDHAAHRHAPDFGPAH